jgi:hypothetical protein
VSGRRLAVAGLALALGACAPEPPCGLRVCDIREAECQRMAAQAAACLRGEPAIDIPVTLVGRDEFVAEAAATTLSPDEAERFRLWNAGYATLALAPVDNDPGQASAANAASTAAFYDPDEKRITVIDDGRPLDHWTYIPTLVHEFTHALQDARFDLDALFGQHATDTDRALAFGAVVEGDATYTGDLASAGFFGLATDDIPWDRVLGNWQSWALVQARISPLPVELAWAHFRYPFGTGFVKGALDAAGTAGVANAFTTPPDGTRQVMAGFGAAEPGGGVWNEDFATAAVPILDPRFTFVGADRMGAWLLEVFLTRLDGPSADRDALTRGLRGDVLSIFHDPVTDGAIAVWRLRPPRPSVSDSTYYRRLDWLGSVVRQLPAARVEGAVPADGDSGEDIVIVAATSRSLLDDVSPYPPFQAIPPASGTAPLTASVGRGCARQPNP